MTNRGLLIFVAVSAALSAAGSPVAHAQTTKNSTTEYQYGRRHVRITPSKRAPSLKIWFDHAQQEIQYQEEDSRSYVRRAYYDDPNHGLLPPRVENWNRPLSEEERKLGNLDPVSTKTEMEFDLRFDFKTPWKLFEETMEDYVGVYWLAEPTLKEFLIKNKAKADRLAEEARAWLDKDFDDDDGEESREAYLDLYDAYFGESDDYERQEYLNTLPLMEEFRRDVLAGKVKPGDERKMGIPYDKLTKEMMQVNRPALFVTHAERTLDTGCIITPEAQKLVDAFEAATLPIVEQLDPHDGLEGWAHQVESKTSTAVRVYGGEHPFEFCTDEMTSVGNWFMWCQQAAFREASRTYFEKNPTGTFTVHIPTNASLLPPQRQVGPESPERDKGQMTVKEYLNRYGMTEFLDFINQHYSAEASYEVRVDGKTVQALKPGQTNKPGPQKIVLEFWHELPHPILRSK